MARIEFDQLESYPYSMGITVRYKDVNSAMHLGYDHLVSLLQEARLAFFLHYNYDEIKNKKTGFIIADLGVQYKSEAFYGDNLIIEVGIKDVRQKGFDIQYRVTQKKTGKVVALAKTGTVCFSYEEKKAVAIPDELLSGFPV